MSGIIGGAGSKSGIIGETELDYEEGTWTAALLCGSGSATFNASYNTGSYTKIGRLVHVSGWLFLTAVSSPSGSLNVTGLPFPTGASPEDSEYSAVTFGYLQNWDALTTGHKIEGHIATATSQFHIGSSNALTREEIADHLNYNSTMTFSLTYMTD